MENSRSAVLSPAADEPARLGRGGHSGPVDRSPAAAASGARRRASRPRPVGRCLPAAAHAAMMPPHGAAMPMMAPAAAVMPVAAVMHAAIEMRDRVVPIGMRVVGVHARHVVAFEWLIGAHFLRRGRSCNRDARRAECDDERCERLHTMSSPGGACGRWKRRRIRCALVPVVTLRSIFARPRAPVSAESLGGVAAGIGVLRNFVARGFGRIGGDRVELFLLLGIGLLDRAVAASGQRQAGERNRSVAVRADHGCLPRDYRRFNARAPFRRPGARQYFGARRRAA